MVPGFFSLRGSTPPLPKTFGDSEPRRVAKPKRRPSTWPNFFPAPIHLLPPACDKMRVALHPRRSAGLRCTADDRALTEEADAAAPLPLALQPLQYFVGRWHVEGGTWSGRLEVKPTLGAWLLLQLSLADSANPGCSRATQMRDGYDPHLNQFVRRKEADNGSYFDYRSTGWSQAEPPQWVWLGTGYHFYGQQQGLVRSVCTRHSDNSFCLTDSVQRAGQWQQTYSLTYRRIP
jgi:hypothetical protein